MNDSVKKSLRTLKKNINLIIISLDKGFDKTEKKRKEPSEIA